MPYTLKTQQISVKDPDSGEYIGVDVLAEQTEEGLIAELQAEGDTQVERINQAAVDVQAAVDAAEAEAQQIISDTQSSLDTLETQKNTIAETVASMAELGTDTTLTTPGMAADAKATGDAIGTLNNAISDMITVSYSDNRLDPSSQINADINTTTGAVTPNEYYSVSGKMPCEYGESLYVVAKADLTNQQDAAIRMAFYTSGDSFIEIQQNVSPFVVPQNAAYCLLRTNKNQIIQEKFGVFPYSGSTMTAWIPYSVTKTLSDDYAPLELSEEVANNTLKTNIINISCGENLLKTLTFEQKGSDNVVSNKFPIKENITYTLSYDGATDNGTAGYVRLYEEDSTTHSQQITFAFKQGFVTFTAQNAIVEAELYFYKSGGLPVSTFPLANPCLVYGSQVVDYVAYKEKLSAAIIPALPERVYTSGFTSLKSLAHMGQSYYYPQNTIWSWIGAKKSGFDYIELIYK